ncbi:MAG: hypothetical protein AAFW98_11865, partial [Pseudomonadota bacterium]
LFWRRGITCPFRLQKRPDVPPDVAAIIMKCLEPEPAERYPSAKALAEDQAMKLRFQEIFGD